MLETVVRKVAEYVHQQTGKMPIITDNDIVVIQALINQGGYTPAGMAQYLGYLDK